MALWNNCAYCVKFPLPVYMQANWVTKQNLELERTVTYFLTQFWIPVETLTNCLDNWCHQLNKNVSQSRSPFFCPTQLLASRMLSAPKPSATPTGYQEFYPVQVFELPLSEAFSGSQTVDGRRGAIAEQSLFWKLKWAEYFYTVK